MPGFVGVPELLLLGFVVLLVFGPKRLPEMGRSLGRGMREFKESVTGEHKDDASQPAQEPAAATASPQLLEAAPVATPARPVDQPVVEQARTSQ